MGLPLDPRSTAVLGEVGLRATGSAASGAGFGSQVYGALRSDEVAGYLSTLVSSAEKQGAGIGELVQQGTHMTEFLRRTQGQGAINPVQVAGFLSALNRLPGGIGRGQGGTEIAQSFLGEQSDPVMLALQLRSYMKATGERPPTDAAALNRFAEWTSRPEGAAALLEGMRGELGPDLAAYMARTRRGLAPATARRLFEHRGPYMDEDVTRLLSPGEAAARFGDENRELAEETFGGRSLDVRIGLERTRAQEGLTPEASTWIDEFRRDYPVEFLAAVGAGGGALGAGLGVGGVAAMSRMFGLFRRLRRTRPIASGIGTRASAARAAGAVAAGGSRVVTAARAAGTVAGSGVALPATAAIGGTLALAYGARRFGEALERKGEMAPSMGEGAEEMAASAEERARALEMQARRSRRRLTADERAAILAGRVSELPEQKRVEAQRLSAGRVDPRDPMFDEAARRYGVPAALLRG
ncbi:MAG: hypothetical protein ACREQY_05140, partial [Candidatus Binatia bacterium]